MWHLSKQRNIYFYTFTVWMFNVLKIVIAWQTFMILTHECFSVFLQIDRIASAYFNVQCSQKFKIFLANNSLSLYRSRSLPQSNFHANFSTKINKISEQQDI